MHEDLKSGRYEVEPYIFFYVRDPKLRPIHKASLRDRVSFQAVFRVLYRIFDKKFIFDSYSCRYNKGVHAGVKRLRQFVLKVGANYHHPVFALKCDVKKFFASIDHKILLELLAREIKDENVLRLLEKIIYSFGDVNGRGLPLGNVTSQLFANIYLNELDQFIKHSLKENYYLRYCDDFIILGDSKKHLSDNICLINSFLAEHLKLVLHPDKTSICKLSQGIDFLGYIVLLHHIILRTETKTRMFKKIKQRKRELEVGDAYQKEFEQMLQSYFGVLKHCNGYKIKKHIGVEKRLKISYNFT